MDITEDGEDVFVQLRMLSAHRHARSMVRLFHPEAKQDGQSFGLFDELNRLLSLAFSEAKAYDF